MHRRRTMNDTTKLSAIAKSLILIAIVGAVNWGLIGFFNYNLVDALFGGGSAEQTSTGSRVIYALVGIAGILAAIMLPRLRAGEPAAPTHLRTGAPGAPPHRPITPIA